MYSVQGIFQRHFQCKKVRIILDNILNTTTVLIGNVSFYESFYSEKKTFYLTKKNVSVFCRNFFSFFYYYCCRLMSFVRKGRSYLSSSLTVERINIQGRFHKTFFPSFTCHLELISCTVRPCLTLPS